MGSLRRGSLPPPRAASILFLVIFGFAVLFAVAKANGDGQDDSSNSPAVSSASSEIDDGAGQATTSTDFWAPADDETAAATSVLESQAESVFSSDEDFWWLWTEPAAIRMAWRDESDQALGQLQFARSALEETGLTVVAITNGGIYGPGLVPLGLYIEHGVELVSLNQRNGGGNFFLEPNGVFWVAGNEAGVASTSQFSAGYQPPANFEGNAVQWAVQSGPMLVVDGMANELFTLESESIHIRNAVAVDDRGKILLIRSRGAVTMRALADRCLELGAVNALYLDGTISRLDQVMPGRFVFPNIPYASMIALVE